jgi:hypothetical protein
MKKLKEQVKWGLLKLEQGLLVAAPVGAILLLNYNRATIFKFDADAVSFLADFTGFVLGTGALYGVLVRRNTIVRWLLNAALDAIESWPWLRRVITKQWPWLATSWSESSKARSRASDGNAGPYDDSGEENSASTEEVTGWRRSEDQGPEILVLGGVGAILTVLFLFFVWPVPQIFQQKSDTTAFREAETPGRVDEATVDNPRSGHANDFTIPKLRPAVSCQEIVRRCSGAREWSDLQKEIAFLIETNGLDSECRIRYEDSLTLPGSYKCPQPFREQSSP